MLLSSSCRVGGSLFPVGVGGRARTVGVLLVGCTVVKIFTHF